MRKPIKKTNRVTKTQQKIINKKAFGDEPNVNPDIILTGIELTKMLNWYQSSIIDDQDGLNFLIEYCKSKNIRYVNDPKKYTRTLFFLVRLLSRGAKLDHSAMNYIQANIHVEKEPKKENVVQKTAFRENPIICDIENMIDQNQYDFDLKQFALSNNITQISLNEIRRFYEPYVSELKEAIARSGDVSVKEAYANFDKKIIKNRLSFLENIVSACDSVLNDKKRMSVRRPRKKKMVDVNKALKTFKHLPVDNKLKIASVDPKNVIGANEIWLYDTKYSILTKLVSNSSSGIMIAGTTFINIDETNSVSKRVGRNRDAILGSVINGGKVALRSIFDNINTDATKPKTRSNEFTVIIRTVK